MKVHPTTAIPPGVKGMSYDSLLVESDDTIFDSGDYNDEQLQIPQSLTVISQTIKQQGDGTSVVEIFFEVDDYPEAVKIDIGFAKV